MSTTILSNYIAKLNHPLKEIRERSLKILTAKLRLGWELEDEIACTRELLEALLNWLQVPPVSLQKEALGLFLTTIKTKSGTYIVKEFGVRNILCTLDNIKRQINDSEALDIFQDLVETLRFLNTVESEDNIAIPRLNLPSITSSESEGGLNSGYYNFGTIQSSNATSISNGEIERNSNKQLIKNTDGIKVLLFPWVDLSISDSKIMFLVGDALKLLKSVRRCCRFIRDVFLRDFPAEIFLNRPSIIKNLVAAAEGIQGNRPDEALHVLLCITRALRRRLVELSCLDLICENRKLLGEQRDFDDDINIELEHIASNGDLEDTQQEEDGLAALRQLPAPIYALDTLHTVLTIVARSIIDTQEKKHTLNLKEINMSMDLIESLIQLLLDCVDEEFWSIDHSSRTYRDVAHKSCMVMRLLGDLLMKYKKAFLEDIEIMHVRTVWVRLVVWSAALLRWARQSALPPAALPAALQQAQLDPALPPLYPLLATRLDTSLQTAKTSVNQEYKTKYKELRKLTASMEYAVRFIKNRNNCRSSKEVLTCIKQSLPVLELHMSETYVNDVAEILLKKTKEFDMDDNDWDLSRRIALNLMAHNVDWVRAKFYSMIADMVQFVLVGDDENQTENEKCLTFLCDVGILTEICCHGLSSKIKQVENSASEIMLYLLRGRLALSEAGWWRVLASLLPVLPPLHGYAAHDTPLGKAICKSLETDIASCMGVSMAEVIIGLVRLMFVRCVAVQLDAAHRLCQLLDDEKYLPPKEALRADVLLNALRRVQPQDFNIDPNSSPSKNPQTTGLVQILEVLKQDIVLDEHGLEYTGRRDTPPSLDVSLRRSTLQQLAMMMRQQDLHDPFLRYDGLRLILAIFRMSLIVDDYLAYPECAISCVSVLNSICFATRHSLAKINDLPSLLVRVILVFPANDSAVLMSAQVLALIAWSGFALQELNAERHRVPALPACVTERTTLPFIANSYWNTSPNAEHSSIEWLLSDEEFRASLRVRWWCAYEGASRVMCGAPPPPAPLALQPQPQDRALLRASCPKHAATTALLALENATSHAQVIDSLSILESYVHLVPYSSVTPEELSALPWQHMRRFLRAPPASSRDTALLIAIMHFMLVYIDHIPSRDGVASWIKSSFIGNDGTILSLLSREQLIPQQTAQESIEVTQLHIHIVKVLLRCIKSLEYDNYDSSKLESLLKILLACLERIDLKNFHALGYLNELSRCIRYVLHSRYCKLSEETSIKSMNILARILSGCARSGGRKGQACRLDALLSLLALLQHMNKQEVPVQRWSEVWQSDVMQAVVSCGRGSCGQLQSAALHVMAALAYYPQLSAHCQQAIREESLSQWAAEVLAETREANIVRAAAAALLTSVTARVSPHIDVVQTEILEQIKNNSIMEHCLEILVGFCSETKYEQYLVPNVPLSLIERRSQLEVRAQKTGHVHISPSLASVGKVPPTATLVTAIADLIHNVSAFEHCPVQEWNEHGIYRLLFKCVSFSCESTDDAYRVRAAACRALVAAAPHKCVRSALSTTKDCLHNLLKTLTPFDEDEASKECLDACAQGLLLLASLLTEHAASDSVWADFKDKQLSTFFCFLLQGLAGDEIELQTSALYCLAQLAQSILHKKHLDKYLDDSWIEFLDNLKSPYFDSQRSDRLCYGDGSKVDCLPEYIVEETCKVLISLYQKISLVNKKYQTSQDEPWTRICSCLSSLLSVSPRSRSYAVHQDLPKVLVATMQGIRDHLSVLGKPIETIKNANHNPTLRTLYWLLTVMNSSMVECPAAKERFSEDGIAVSLNRLWPWCMMTEQLRHAVTCLLFNFTNECPKAWCSMSSCVGNRNLVSEVCALAGREAALQSRARAPARLLLCVDTLRHCAAHHHCRAVTLKSDILSCLYKTIVRDRGRGGGPVGLAWAKLCSVVARYADGAGALLALKPLLPALSQTLRSCLMPALAHAAHHHRVTFLQSPDLLELLSGTLLSGDTTEVISAARAVWMLAANNHKAKLQLRSAGVASAVSSALQRLQRARNEPPTNRALQLLLYTHTVLQTT